MSWRLPCAFSRGQAHRVGLTSTGIHCASGSTQELAPDTQEHSRTFAPSYPRTFVPMSALDSADRDPDSAHEIIEPGVAVQPIEFRMDREVGQPLIPIRVGLLQPRKRLVGTAQRRVG